MAVATGDFIVAQVITDLINEIKSEFERRDNPYNTTGLVEAAQSLSISPLDSEDTYIIYETYSQAITQLDNYVNESYDDALK
jgi:hypothetical protein